MEDELNIEEWQEAARQLRCPEGADGLLTGERMNRSNGGMIRAAWNSLPLRPDISLLEIGPGNGLHISGIMDRFFPVHYIALDISETMLGEIARNNPSVTPPAKLECRLADGQNIPLADQSADMGFTVNTLYFWKDPVAYMKEIFRVLKPGGIFSIAFVCKRFMETLPFVSYGFTLYTLQEAETLIKEAGGVVHQVLQETEQILSNGGYPVERTYYILRCSRP